MLAHNKKVLLLLLLFLVLSQRARTRKEEGRERRGSYGRGVKKGIF